MPIDNQIEPPQSFMAMYVKQVRIDISALAALGEISTCKVTRFNGDKRFEGTQCRPATFIPPKAPGRKPGPSKVAS